MNKVQLIILLCVTMIISITGCMKRNYGTNQPPSKDINKELLQCLENELGGYLITETDEFVEIPFSDIKDKDKEKIAYYKGRYASNHPDNKYVIVFPKDGTYDFHVMKDFDQYFSKQFSIFQKGDISSIAIYIHTQENNVDFKAISNKCVTNKRPSK